MSSAGRRIVVLGMLTKMPVAGVAWQTLHYLLGFRRLGFDVYYVEAHARTPSMLMKAEDDDSSLAAADYLGSLLKRFGFAGRWAFHALHADGQCYGMTRAELFHLYRSATVIINLHGGTEPLPEHVETGRLVYVETDPVQLQIELHDGVPETVEFLDAHAAFFTFGENLGAPDCTLPISERFQFYPTRQPVVLELWPQQDQTRSMFTTVGNWRQDWRPVTLGGETYSWSKHVEFAKVIDLPARTGQRFELALSSYTADDYRMLTDHGWSVQHGLDVSIDLDTYRDYISTSRAEFTVAKDQNIRMRSGWFSDRSATYLAAGRPVVTQETGFSNVLPTGEGLLPFSTVEDAADAVASVAGNYGRHSAAALDIARECFDSDVVLRKMLDQLGEARPFRSAAAKLERCAPLPAELLLTPISKRPTVLAATTVSAVLGRPLPTDLEPDSCSGPGVDVSIVIVSFSQLVFTRMCLETVLATTSAATEVIVVDNGSTDGTVDYLQQVSRRCPRVRTFLNPDNVGFPRAANQGLAAARGETLVLLNNDTVVTGDWLPVLARHLDDPTVGLVGPITNAAPNEARVKTDYSTYGELVAFAAALPRTSPPFDISVVTMFCAALRRSTYENVGSLDESFGLGMFEDDDYAERIRGAGLRVMCAPDVFVHHFGEASFGHLVSSGRHGAIFRANQEWFEQKWGRTWEPHQNLDEDDYSAMIKSIHQVVRRHVPSDAAVLVVSKGDEQLLRLDGRRSGHFPQDEYGGFAGYYPADDAEAIAHLEALHAHQGSAYLLFPRTSLWWLEHYTGFRDHLGRRYVPVVDDDDCLILTLRSCG